MPISITALGKALMDKQGVRDIKDIARLVPGLNLQTSDVLGDTNISIAASFPIPARRPPAFTSTIRRYRRGRRSCSATHFQKSSIWIGSRCCADRRARCSAPAPRVARCGSLRRRRA
ncbi:MAG: Plug domain-containing protein [Rhodospirillales bacterium]